MKILLVNAYLRNTGDAALSSVLIDQLKAAWLGVDIIVSSVEEPAEWPTFEACQNIGSIRLYAGLVNGNKLHRLARKALVLGVELCWGHMPTLIRRVVTRLLPRMVRTELRALEAADLVVSTAGGYLCGPDSLAGDLSVRYMLLPLKLAVQLGKPVELAPQSYGAFGNHWQEKAVRAVLGRAECIMTREGKSYELLKALNIPEDTLVRSVDVAFAFEPRLTERASKRPKTPLKIGVTTRSWSSPAKQQAYETALAALITHVQKHYAAKLVVISHVMKDVYSDDGSSVDRSIAALARKAGAEVEVIDTTDHHAMKKLYDSLDFIVGTRFHSVIFSLTAGVPAMAIEYQHKTSGIMQDLGLSEWVINFDDVTGEKLQQLFDKLVEKQTAYRQQMYRVLPTYISDAQGTGQVLKQAYERWQHAAANTEPLE